MGYFWLVIKQKPEHILGSLNRSAFGGLLNLVAHKAYIMLYWGGCGKVRKLRKTAGPLKGSQKPGPKCRTSLQEELLHGYHY